MKCPLCPVALIALAALAGSSLLALTQPDTSTTTHRPDAKPTQPKPDPKADPKSQHGTNMPNPDQAQPANHPIAQPDPDDMAKMMQLMKDTAALGPNHELLGSWIGKWDTSTKMFMAPGAPPQSSHGHSEFSWAIDGRWLQEHHEGEMMGMPMKGFGLTGYDTFNKKFVNCWVDNFSNSMISTSGSLDPSGKVLTLFGLMDEPATGEHGKTVRFQTTMTDKDTRKLTIDEVSYGQPFTVVEVTYTRAK